jgi:hypothetical protein
VPFEWYSEWVQLRPLLRAAVGADVAAEGGAQADAAAPAGGRVLVVGCGNSELSAQMYDDGFVDITNIDFSKARVDTQTPQPKRSPIVSRRAVLTASGAPPQVCIASMMGKHVRERPKMRWLVMDATAMKARLLQRSDTLVEFLTSCLGAVCGRQLRHRGGQGRAGRADGRGRR